MNSPITSAAEATAAAVATSETTIPLFSASFENYLSRTKIGPRALA
jgi:hypothetical protein